MHMSATPAYGRDYKSKKEVQADYDADKDFIVHHMGGTTYINRPQCKEENITLNIRYKNQTRVHVVKPS